jgi:hypothetical protein
LTNCAWMPRLIAGLGRLGAHATRGNCGCCALNERVFSSSHRPLYILFLPRYRIFRLRGTPDVHPIAWPEVAALPDYHKISFPTMHALPLTQVLPDAPPAALDLIEKLLVFPVWDCMASDNDSRRVSSVAFVMELKRIFHAISMHDYHVCCLLSDTHPLTLVDTAQPHRRLPASEALLHDWFFTEPAPAPTAVLVEFLLRSQGAAASASSSASANVAPLLKCAIESPL